jgi:hypothetical protein
MKNDEEIIGEAVRVEYSEQEGRLFLVFEIKSEKHKQRVREQWSRDIEYKLIDKQLIASKEE